MRVFLGELLAAGSTETVVFGPSIILRNSPFRGEPPAQLEPVKRGVERAFLHAEHFVGALTDQFGDGVAVLSAGGQSLEDEHVESALNEVA